MQFEAIWVLKFKKELGIFLNVCYKNMPLYIPKLYFSNLCSDTSPKFHC